MTEKKIVFIMRIVFIIAGITCLFNFSLEAQQKSWDQQQVGYRFWDDIRFIVGPACATDLKCLSERLQSGQIAHKIVTDTTPTSICASKLVDLSDHLNAELYYSSGWRLKTKELGNTASTKRSWVDLLAPF